MIPDYNVLFIFAIIPFLSDILLVVSIPCFFLFLLRLVMFLFHEYIDDLSCYMFRVCVCGVGVQVRCSSATSSCQRQISVVAGNYKRSATCEIPKVDPRTARCRRRFPLHQWSLLQRRPSQSAGECPRTLDLHCYIGVAIAAQKIHPVSSLPTLAVIRRQKPTIC